VKLGKTLADPVFLPERLIRERAAKEKRTFFRDAHSDRVDTFDGRDFVVGQVFCAQATREFAANKQTGDNDSGGDNSSCGIVLLCSFDFRK